VRGITAVINEEMSEFAWYSTKMVVFLNLIFQKKIKKIHNKIKKIHKKNMHQIY